MVRLNFIRGIHFICICLAQSRSTHHLKQFDEYFLQSPNESDLLRNRKIHRHHSNGNDGSSSINDNELEREEFVNPRFFHWPKVDSPKSHSQPTGFYGRKSHWDTFFGRK